MDPLPIPHRTAIGIRLLVEVAVRKIGDPPIVEGLKTFLVPNILYAWWQKTRSAITALSSLIMVSRSWGLVFHLMTIP
jgi:hypothetical protein